MKLLDVNMNRMPVTLTTGKRHKTNGAATAAMLIQIASEMLETAPTLRKQMGVTLSDLAAANKVRKELIRKTLPVQ